MVSGVLGIIIWSTFDWVELLTIHIIQWYCPWSVRNYLPRLDRNMVAFSVDAVFIAVGDQATIIEHLFKRRIRAFSKVGCNHDQFNCRSVDFSKSRVPSHTCLEVNSDSSRNSFGELKLIGDYPCLHTKRRHHGCPARSLATNHRDFPYLNKLFNLCLPWQRCQKCLLMPTNVTTGNQRCRPQTSMGWQVFHESRINPQAHGVPP